MPEGSVEDSGLNEPEGEGVEGELDGKAGDRPFSRLALVFGVGFAGIFLASCPLMVASPDDHADDLGGIRLAVLWLAVAHARHHDLSRPSHVDPPPFPRGY